MNDVQWYAQIEPQFNYLLNSICCSFRGTGKGYERDMHGI